VAAYSRAGGVAALAADDIALDQTPYWVALTSVAGIGPARMRGLLDYFGSADRAWSATLGDLIVSGLERRAAEALAAARRTIDPEREMARLEAAGVRALTLDSEAYPQGSVRTQTMGSFISSSSGMLTQIQMRMPDELPSLLFPYDHPTVQENISGLQCFPLQNLPQCVQ
jgi:predicted Rossmann fold nucleotide-binding protein DprA/Smf involved in DNA uptake